MPTTSEDYQAKLQARTEQYERLLAMAFRIAEFPVDQWLMELDRADAIAPIVDPTLYRDYIYSNKSKILNKILRAALEMKRTVEDVRPLVMEEFMKELEKKQEEMGI